MMELPICFECKNYFGGFRCRAFPGKIPDSILDGYSDHADPMPGQRGEYTFNPEKPCETA